MRHSISFSQTYKQHAGCLVVKCQYCKISFYLLRTLNKKGLKILFMIKVNKGPEKMYKIHLLTASVQNKCCLANKINMNETSYRDNHCVLYKPLNVENIFKFAYYNIFSTLEQQQQNCPHHCDIDFIITM